MIVINARFLTQQITGVQRFAIEISKWLHKLNDEIIFVVPDDILHPEIALELGVIVIGKNRGTIWEQVDLRAYLIKNHKPLLINFCNTGLLNYKKQIVTIHDMSYKVNPSWFSRSFYVWYNYLIPHLANNSLKLFTVSNSSKNDIIKYLKIKSEKISVIYNAYNLITKNNFDPVYKEKYLLSVSSLEPRKNLNNLIAAYKKTGTNIKLIIVGLMNKRFSLNKELLDNNIIFKGFVSDKELSSLMQQADAFVYLSFYEGFGLPPLEAMSSGRPVIVSDITAHREICGDAALYVDPNDIDDIANKMADIISNDKIRQQLIAAGKINIKRFDWFNSAKEVLGDINEIVEKYK